MSSTLIPFLKTYGSSQEFSEPLNRVGFKSEGFSDPRAFLTRVKSSSPTACLVDAGGEDSLIMIALLKSIRSVLGPKLPLIAVVTQDDPEKEVKARAAGASTVLTKPLSEDELIGAIAEHATSGGQETIPVPKVIKWFFEVLSPALAGLGTAIDNSTELEAQVRFCEIRLRPYQEPFIATVRSMRKTDTKLDLVQCIRMYGLRNARNLLVAMKLSELTGQALVGFSAKTGALVGDPNQVLRYANKTLEHFGEGSRNQVEAFNAGLVLDLLAALVESAGVRKSAVRNFIEERHIEALKNIDRCIGVGKSVKNLALERHIVTTILMREAGKIAMSIFFPEYLEIRRRVEKKIPSIALQHVIELRQFAVSFNLMGALISQGAPGLNEAYRAVLFFDYPYMPSPGDTYDLIRVCAPLVEQPLAGLPSV